MLALRHGENGVFCFFFCKSIPQFDPPVNTFSEYFFKKRKIFFATKNLPKLTNHFLSSASTLFSPIQKFLQIMPTLYDTRLWSLRQKKRSFYSRIYRSTRRSSRFCALCIIGIISVYLFSTPCHFQRIFWYKNRHFEYLQNPNDVV